MVSIYLTTPTKRLPCIIEDGTKSIRQICDNIGIDMPKYVSPYAIVFEGRRMSEVELDTTLENLGVRDGTEIRLSAYANMGVNP